MIAGADQAVGEGIEEVFGRDIENQDATRPTFPILHRSRETQHRLVRYVHLAVLDVQVQR